MIDYIRGHALARPGCPSIASLSLNYVKKAVPKPAPGVIWPPPALRRIEHISLRGQPNLSALPFRPPPSLPRLLLHYDSLI